MPNRIPHIPQMLPGIVQWREIDKERESYCERTGQIRLRILHVELHVNNDVKQ